jgi:hypothetical protein
VPLLANISHDLSLAATLLGLVNGRLRTLAAGGEPPGRPVGESKPGPVHPWRRRPRRRCQRRADGDGFQLTCRLLIAFVAIGPASATSTADCTTNFSVSVSFRGRSRALAGVSTAFLSKQIWNPASPGTSPSSPAGAALTLAAGGVAVIQSPLRDSQSSWRQSPPILGRSLARDELASRFKEHVALDSVAFTIFFALFSTTQTLFPPPPPALR